jgi:RHS repeat-associated protein
MRTAAAVLVIVLVVTPSLYPSVPKSPATAHPPLHASPKSPVSGVYTDDPLVGGVHVIRLVHLAELRAAINDIRIAAGLPTYIWADPQPSIVRAVHVVQLRAALAEALPRLGRSVPPWTDPALTTGSSIRAAHLQEIRNATRWGPSDRSSAITTDTVWIPENSPYVIRATVTIYGGATLTIRPGVVVKFAPGTDLEVTAGARLIADGTSSNPIYFTSLKDDSVGGDTNGDGAATSPAPGDWRLFVFGDTGGAPASGSLTNAVVRYGTSLVVRRSAPTLHDVTSTQMSGDGLSIDSPTATPYLIERLTLTNNTRNLNLSTVPSSTTIRDSLIRGAREMALQATNGTSAQITNNSIDDNRSGAAVLADSTSPITLRYNSITNNRTSDGLARGVTAACCVTVDARFNWWGSTLGPETDNNGTDGSDISGNVLYDNWLGAPWANAFRQGSNPWTLKAGVSTDVSSGNFYLVEKDISIATVGFPLEIVRTYNNKIAGSKIGDLGMGWTWNYGVQLETTTDTNGVIWDRADGVQSYFKRNADDTFSGEEGLYEKLSWDRSSGTYRLRSKDQSVLVFDAAGKLLAQIDANGNTTVITHDSSGRVARVNEPFGRSLTFQYTGNYISRITDPIGRSFEFTHDGNGLITSVISRDQAGTVFKTASYAYSGGPWEMVGYDDGDGNHLSQTFEPDTQRVNVQQYNGLNPISFYYDMPAPGVTTVLDTHGRFHRYYYTANNKIRRHEHQESSGEYVLEDEWQYVNYLASSYTNLDGTTHTVYDWPTGNVAQFTAPGNRYTLYAYDQFNNVTSRTDARNYTTTFEYDDHQNLLRERNPLGELTQHAYYATGLKQSDTDPRGNVTSYSYDGNGYPVSIANALSKTTRYEYDAAGRKTSEADPLGNRTTYTYNGRDQILDITDPLANRTSFSYDQYGRKVATTDAEAHATTYAYNSHNLLWKTTDARSGVVELQYDNLTGNLIRVIDPNLRPTTYTYDDHDRKIFETDGLNRTWHFDYVRANLLGRVVDPAGAVTQRFYTSANDLAQVTYPNNSVVTYSYDPVGNKTSMSDWNGTTNWVYDGLNRIVNVNKGFPDTAYGYDTAGNLSWVRAENFKPVSYTYDALNRLSTVSDWTGRVTTYGYDDASRMTSCTYPNGVVGTWFYDAVGRIQRIAYSTNGTLLDSRDYTMNRVGDRTSQTDVLGQRTSYFYDEIDRLYFVSNPNNTAYQFGYDACGNRTAITFYQNGVPNPTSFYYFDAANQSQNSQYGTTIFDANGNLVQAGPSRFLSWNPQQRLASVNDTYHNESFVYDGDGRRIRQVVNGVTTDSIVDTRPALFRSLIESTGGNRTYFVYGYDLLYSIDGNVPHYVHPDALGSIILATDASGRREGRFSYDPFGTIIEASATYWPRRFFTGEESDAAVVQGTGSHLVYLRARYYDTLIGRFLSFDPKSGNVGDTQTWNGYAYARNNPMTLTDHSGESFGPVVDAIIAFLAGYKVANAPDIGDAIIPSRSDAEINRQTAFIILGGGVAESAASALHTHLAYRAIGSTGRVGESFLRTLGGESKVYLSTSRGARYIDQLVNGVALESKVGYQSLTPSIIQQIAKDVELLQSGQVLGVEWHFFRSPVTNAIGPSGPLSKWLMQNGIRVIIH